MGRDAGARRSCSHLLGDIKRSASNKRTTPLPTPPSNLKPASPPKINPWHRNGPGESSGQDLQQEPASTPEQSDHVAKDKLLRTSRKGSDTALQSGTTERAAESHSSKANTQPVAPGDKEEPRRTKDPQPSPDIDSFPAFPPLEGTSTPVRQPSNTFWAGSRKLFAKPNPPAQPRPKDSEGFPSLPSVIHSEKRRSSQGEVREGRSEIGLEPFESPSQASTQSSKEATAVKSSVSPKTSEKIRRKSSSIWDGPLPKILTAEPFVPAASMRSPTPPGKESQETRYRTPKAYTQDSPKSVSLPDISGSLESSPAVSPTMSLPLPLTRSPTEAQPPFSASRSQVADRHEVSELSGGRNLPRQRPRSAFGGTPAVDGQNSPVSSAESQSSTEEATREDEELWKHPVGADVHVITDATVYYVHRSVITRQSGWFRDYLPPPNMDGSPVEIRTPQTDGAVVHCLNFMYTHRSKICEYSKQHTLNMIHLPRCVLAYAGAVSLRIDRMVSYLVHVVESTGIHLANTLEPRSPLPDHEWSVAFVMHLHHALLVTYMEGNQYAMRPMRMALASVLEASLCHLMGRPAFAELIRSPAWQRHHPAISADLAEYRQMMGIGERSQDRMMFQELAPASP